MGDTSSIFGGNTLASLFGLGTAAAPAAPAAASDPYTGFDPATGTPYPTYDPTGTLGAQAAVTGSYAPPAPVTTGTGTGGTDGDTQTSNTADKSDAAKSGSTAPSGPAPVNPQSLAAMMQGQPLPTQPANPWQPGGGSPATFPGQRYGNWSSTLMGPEGGGGGVPASYPVPPQPPPGQMAGADQPTGTPSNAAPVPPEQPDDTDKTDKTDKTPTPQGGKAAAPADTTPPPAATPPPSQPPGPAVGQGGMPGGAGNLLTDIAGIMSGNPMALGKLVQDLMRMAGPPGGRQMPGWDQPFMRPNQASPYTQAGDPSTFGGPQYAGATPGQTPGGGAPGAGPQQFRPGIGPGQGPYRTGYARTGPVQQYGRTPPGGQIPGQAAPRLNTAPGQTVGGQGAKPFNVDANPSDVAAAPSMRGDGSFPVGQSSVGPIVASTLRRAGLNNNAIQGIMYNIHRESSFNPSSREADQPKFGGEAHYAHGLYQEGGDEWNKYSRWLQGRNWRDPQLQTQFLAQNMQRYYPRLWKALQSARTPEDAAAMFAQYYLRPSAPNLVSRLRDIRSGAVRRIGVPADQPANSPVQIAGVTQ